MNTLLKMFTNNKTYHVTTTYPNIFLFNVYPFPFPGPPSPTCVMLEARVTRKHRSCDEDNGTTRRDRVDLCDQKLRYVTLLDT